MTLPIVKIEHELATGIWTDLGPLGNNDVLTHAPGPVTISWRQGITGSGPLDLTAGIGSLRYPLDDSAGNSGRLKGYYSPNNANVRAGFARGIAVRLYIDAGNGAVFYPFYGRLVDVDPQPGRFPVTFCEVQDYMAVLEDLTDLRLALLEASRTDQGISAIVAQADEAPLNTDYDVGLTTPDFMFDDLGGRVMPATGVAQRINVSEGYGRLFVTGNATDGETLCWRNRHAATIATVSASFDEDELHPDDPLDAASKRSDAINEAFVSSVGREIGTAPEVLYQADSEIAVGPGQTEYAFFDYVDPDQRVARIGGKDIVDDGGGNLPPTTDYTANASSGGGGADLTGVVVGLINEFAYGGMIEFSNSGAVTAYVRGPGTDEGFRVRGTALRTFNPVERREVNSTSITANGRQGIAFIMPYQADAAIAKGLAQFTVQAWGTVGSYARRVRVATELTSVLQKAITLRVGDKIEVTESVTGLSTTEHIIQGIEGEIRPGRQIAMWFTLAPIETVGDIWIWDTASVFDTNRFAYV